MEICKRGACKYAREHGIPVLWAQGIDIAKSDALVGKPDLHKDKVMWLQRHDRECGGLYGMLPLVRGMKVIIFKYEYAL